MRSPFRSRRCACALASLLAVSVSFTAAHAQSAAPEPASASVAVHAVMNLAFLLPRANTEPSPVPADHLSNGERIGYDVGVVGTGLLIASDDRGLYRTIQGPNGPSPAESRIANDVTHLGDLTYVAPALGAVYLLGGNTNHQIAWRSADALLKAGAIGLAIKEIAGRERPGSSDPGSAGAFHLFRGSADGDQSFPSGHTLVAFTVATVWAGEEPHESILAYGLASAVGLSRIVGKDHWPSDVFFGALLGFTQGRQALHGNTNLLDIKF